MPAMVGSGQPGLRLHPALSPTSALSVPGSGLHQPHPSPPVGGEEVVRGIAVEKFDIVKKWGINTYKVSGGPGHAAGGGLGQTSPCSRPTGMEGRGPDTPFLCLQCTKQLISERFGRGSRTVDLELETQIELLRETKRKYECVLQLARALTNHFYSLVQTQHALGDAFADLSQKSPELQVCPLGWWCMPCLCWCSGLLCLGRRPGDPE